MSQDLITAAEEGLWHDLAIAIDAIDTGILLLDAGMRVRFVNARMTDLFALPESPLAGGLGAMPTFRTLLEHAASQSLYAVDPDELQDYIDRRETAVRQGHVAPTRINLTDGRRLLFSCAAGPNGQRVLSYVDIAAELARERATIKQMIDVEMRFRTETLEDQAAYLVAVAENADQSAREVEEARRALECQVMKQRELEAELRQMATTDGLTGALNRAGFLTLAQQHVEEGRDGRLAVLMLDVDHFKRINDQFGHAGGDAALRHLVTVLRGDLRDNDLLGRVGGEEFAIVLTVASADVALGIAERLRCRVSESQVLFGSDGIRMTISLGLAIQRPDDRTIEPLIARADTALYQAKHDGRNRVVAEAVPL